MLCMFYYLHTRFSNLILIFFKGTQTQVFDVLFLNNLFLFFFFFSLIFMYLFPTTRRYYKRQLLNSSLVIRQIWLSAIINYSQISQGCTKGSSQKVSAKTDDYFKSTDKQSEDALITASEKLTLVAKFFLRRLKTVSEKKLE